MNEENKKNKNPQLNFTKGLVGVLKEFIISNILTTGQIAKVVSCSSLSLLSASDKKNNIKIKTKTFCLSAVKQ